MQAPGGGQSTVLAVDLQAGATFALVAVRCCAKPTPHRARRTFGLTSYRLVGMDLSMNADRQTASISARSVRAAMVEALGQKRLEAAVHVIGSKG
jgi:hypothetical protein